MLILCQDIPKCYFSLHFLESSAYILLVTALLCLSFSNGWVHVQPYDGKRASSWEQQLRGACCHQNEPFMLQLILQEPLGKPHLDGSHRWTRLPRVQQTPLKHPSVSAALRNGWHQTGELLYALVCDHWAMWDCRFFYHFRAEYTPELQLMQVSGSFSWFMLKFFLAEFYPFEHFKIIPFLS